MSTRKRLIIAMTGATGAIYGVRLLQVLQQYDDWETHLIISDAGLINLKHELGMQGSELLSYADVSYNINNIAAPLASGAFETAGMIVAPCSMKTLSSIAHGYSDNLITRAADVTLKERRRLLIAPRETPLNLIHLRNMTSVTEAGAIVYPPLPAFYGKTKTLSELIDEGVGRMLGLLGMQTEGLFEPWEGLKPEA